MGLKTRLMSAFAGRTRVCVACWRPNAAEATFCAGCGRPMAEGAAEAGAEEALAQTAESLFKELEPDRPSSGQPKVACRRCSAELPATVRYCHSCGDVQEAQRESDTAPLGGFGVAVGSGRPRLAVLNADGTLRKAWPITAEVVLIGASDGDVLLEQDPFVAPRQGRLFRRDERWVIEDLGTVNGIYRRILGPEELSAGDYVRAGRQIFRVVDYGELFGARPPPVPSTQTRFLGSPVQADERVYLAQVLENRRVGHLLSLDGCAPRSVGRKKGDMVFAEDDFLSGRHVEFELREGRCVVKDLQGRNGVYVRIAEPTPIVPGQLLLFGETLVRFEVS